MLRLISAAACGLGMLLALVLAPPTAHAQDDDIRDSRGVWYAATGFEGSLVVSALLLAGGAALMEAGDGGSGGSGGGEMGGMLLGSCLIAAIALGVAADANRWDPAPALAIHGGLWNLVLGGFLGALLDGADATDGTALAFGPWTIVLALAGVGLATLTSFTQFERGIEATCWYLAPIAGLITGLITWLATDAWQDAGADETAQNRRAWSAALLGFAVPVAAAHVIPFAVRD